jgi:hypothetical protein
MGRRADNSAVATSVQLSSDQGGVRTLADKPRTTEARKQSNKGDSQHGIRHLVHRVTDTTLEAIPDSRHRSVVIGWDLCLTSSNPLSYFFEKDRM